MKKSAPLQHLDYLDGLRAVATIFVVIHHALLQVNLERQPLTGVANYLVRFFSHGNYAVDLFIVLSGFCLMLPVVRGDGTIRAGTIEFFKRRCWRILPAYYLAMVFSLALIWFFIGHKTGTHWDVSIPVTDRNIIGHILLVHDAFNDSTINHSLWSISVEWRIYFFFPLLVLFWRKIGPISTTLLALFASYILHHLAWRLVGDSLDLNYLGLFAMGMFAASIKFSKNSILFRWQQLPWRSIATLMTIVVIALSSIQIHKEVLSRYLVDYVVGGWCMTLLVMLAVNDRGWLSKVLSYRPLVFVGTFAYSIYLIHAPLLQIIWQYLFVPWQTNDLLMFSLLSIVGTPIIIGLSYIFFLLCEQPFLNQRQKSN